MTEVDLVVRTLANIKELKAEEPKTAAEEAASAGQVSVFEDASPPAPIEPPGAEPGNVQAIEGLPVEDPPGEPSPERMAEPKLETAEHDVPSPGNSTPKALEDSNPVIPFQFELHAALKKAVLNPDIYTDKEDRSRAVDLRWTLRDIRAKRTNWWAVSDRDLRVLIEMGFVEMREDVPVLTTLGFDAIA